MAALVKRASRLSWPFLARASWVLLASISLGLILLMVPINIRTIYFAWTFEQSYRAVADFMTQKTYASIYMALNYGVAALCYCVAGLIAWRRAAEPVAWLAAVLLALVPIMFSLGGYSETWSYYPLPWRDIFKYLREFLAWAVGLSSMLAFIFLFPNARSTPRWTAVLLGLLSVTMVLTTIALMLGLVTDAYGGWLGSFITSLALGAGIQIYRYRRLSSPIERQQTKWVVAALAGIAGAMVVVTILNVLAENGRYAALVQLLAQLTSVTMLAFLPLALAF